METGSWAAAPPDLELHHMAANGCAKSSYSPALRPGHGVLERGSMENKPHIECPHHASLDQAWFVFVHSEVIGQAVSTCYVL